jgi:hypothetical protein
MVALGPEGRSEFGIRSRDIVTQFGIDAAVRATEAAVRFVCASEATS